MKRLICTSFLMLALAFLTVAPGAAAEETAVAPVPEEPAAQELTPQAEAACPAPDAATTLGLTLEPARHCPFGAPHCFKDDHCDTYCGDPRFGFCFSNGCCGCTG